MDSVNGTFYELMNISINATAKEIKREYKKQAMVIHPDKNPETEEQFKQLAAVYNILKDERTRAMYHRVGIKLSYQRAILTCHVTVNPDPAAHGKTGFNTEMTFSLWFTNS